jgi:hypothetical protein
MDLITLDGDMFDYNNTPSDKTCLYRSYYLVDAPSRPDYFKEYDLRLIRILKDTGWYLCEHYLPKHHMILIDCVTHTHSFHLLLHYRTRLLTYERYVAIRNNEHCVFIQGFYSEPNTPNTTYCSENDKVWYVENHQSEAYRKRMAMFCSPHTVLFKSHL